MWNSKPKSHMTAKVIKIGKGDRDSTEQHGPQVSQEEEDEDHRDDDRIPQGIKHVLNAQRDEVLLCVAYRKIDEGISCLELREGRLLSPG